MAFIGNNIARESPTKSSPMFSKSSRRLPDSTDAIERVSTKQGFVDFQDDIYLTEMFFEESCDEIAHFFVNGETVRLNGLSLNLFTDKIFPHI